MFNNDLNYARSRLTGTYMMTKKDELLYIEDIAGEDNDLSRATVYVNDEKRKRKISDFRFAIGPMGYSRDRDKGIVYIERIPLRREWRQGLRHTQLAISKGGSSSGVGSRWLPTNFKNLEKSIRGEVPKFLDAVEMVEEGEPGAALSRSFALLPSYKIGYRGHIVGSLTKNERVKLKNGFEFLEQELIRSIGNENFSRN